VNFGFCQPVRTVHPGGLPIANPSERCSAGRAATLLFGTWVLLFEL
jgi:hypothetical protein